MKKNPAQVLSTVTLSNVVLTVSNQNLILFQTISKVANGLQSHYLDLLLSEKKAGMATTNHTTSVGTAHAFREVVSKLCAHQSLACANKVLASESTHASSLLFDQSKRLLQGRDDLKIVRPVGHDPCQNSRLRQN